MEAAVGLGVPLCGVWIAGTLWAWRRAEGDREAQEASTGQIEHSRSRNARITAGRRVEYVVILSEFVQLAAFPLAVPGVPWHLAGSFYDVMRAMALRFSDVTFWSWFVLVQVAYLSAGLRMLYRWWYKIRDGDEDEDDDEEDEKDEGRRKRELKWMILLFLIDGGGAKTILYEVLMVPAIRVNLQMMACSYAGPEPVLKAADSVECWTGVHFLPLVMAVIFICALYPATMAFLLTKNDDDPEVRYVIRFYIILVATEIALTAVSVLFESYVLESLIIMFFAILALLGFNVYLQPALGRGAIYNHWRSAALSVAALAAILSLAAESEGEDDGGAFTWTFVALTPFVAAGAFMGSRQRQIHLRQMSIEQLSAVESLPLAKQIKTLRNNLFLALSPTYRTAVIEHGGLAALLACARSDDTRVQTLAAKVLANFALGKTKAPMYRAGALPILVDMGQRRDAVGGAALAALVNLAAPQGDTELSRKVRGDILEELGGELTELFAAAQTGPPSVQSGAIRLLATLSAEKASRELFLAKGALSLLNSLLISCRHSGALRALAMWTGRVTGDKAHRDAVLAGAALDNLVKMLTNENASVRNAARLTLKVIAKRDVDRKQVIVRIAQREKVSKSTIRAIKGDRRPAGRRSILGFSGGSSSRPGSARSKSRPRSAQPGSRPRSAEPKSRPRSAQPSSPRKKSAAQPSSPRGEQSLRPYSPKGDAASRRTSRADSLRSTTGSVRSTTGSMRSTTGSVRSAAGGRSTSLRSSLPRPKGGGGKVHPKRVGGKDK